MKKMTDQELSTEVQKAVGTVFRVPGTKISPATTLVGDLGAESIDFLDLGAIGEDCRCRSGLPEAVYGEASTFGGSCARHYYPGSCGVSESTS